MGKSAGLGGSWPQHVPSNSWVLFLKFPEQGQMSLLLFFKMIWGILWPTGFIASLCGFLSRMLSSLGVSGTGCLKHEAF